MYLGSSRNQVGNFLLFSIPLFGKERGRPLLRKLLFFASINVVRKGGVLHEQYQHHLKKGMPQIKALVAISRKLLSIIFALVRDHGVYIARYSKTQQLKEAA